MTENKKLRPANENPDFGKVCKHKSLKRQCYVCELEDDIDRLKAEKEEQKKWFQGGMAILKEAIRRKDEALEKCIELCVCQTESEEFIEQAKEALKDGAE